MDFLYRAVKKFIPAVKLKILTCEGTESLLKLASSGCAEDYKLWNVTVGFSFSATEDGAWWSQIHQTHILTRNLLDLKAAGHDS